MGVDVLALAADGEDRVGMVVDEESEMGFLRGEGCALEGGFVDWVESDDLPRAIAMAEAVALAAALFFSALADPIGVGRVEGDGGGKAELDLSDTMLPILSDFVPLTPPVLLAGTVLTEMFLPHPAELGNADDPASSALGLGQCDLIVKGGGATAAACFCLASYSAGLVNATS